MAGEIRQQRASLERAGALTVRHKLEHLIATEARGGVYPVAGSLKDLAALLGVTHEALYRTLARMEREGVLCRGQEGLRLL